MLNKHLFSINKLRLIFLLMKVDSIWFKKKKKTINNDKNTKHHFFFLIMYIRASASTHTKFIVYFSIKIYLFFLFYILIF